MSSQQPATSLIVRFCPKHAAKQRLFCFPYAGGNASVFRSWAEILPAHIEVCAVQPPGRGQLWREPAYTRWNALVETLDKAIAPYLDLPCAFFGYSVGAIVGFELARLLARRRRPGPFHLFVASCRAPQLERSGPVLHDLPNDAFLECLRQFRGIPEHILQDTSTMEFFLPTLRADFTLYETYKFMPDILLNCSLSAYGGLHDPLVSPKSIQPWRYVTTGQFTLRTFPGNHFFLRDACEALLQAIADDSVYCAV